VKSIGVLEILTAIGLILPAALGIPPTLTAVAAVGAVLHMVGAAATHVRRREFDRLPLNVARAALAVFVAAMRFGPHSL
jgi:DoxX-like protein